MRQCYGTRILLTFDSGRTTAILATTDESVTFRLKLNLAILANLFKRLSDLNKSHLQLLTSKELYLAKAAYKFVVKNILLHRIKTKAANLI